MKPGAGVAVVAPAGPVSEAAYRSGLEILAARYRLVHAYDPAHESPALPYLAAEDAARTAELNQAIRNEQVQAIFCARGGYGTMRILDALDAATFARRRPLLVGFSDITALHAWAAHLGVPTIHGPVVTQLPQLPLKRRNQLWPLLEEGRVPEINGLEGITGGRARGRLLGGNLTVLSHLLGTRFFPALDGAILLLEDVCEAPYRLDRMLTQLRLSGRLDRVAGIVVGQLLHCDGYAGRPARAVQARSVIIERLSPLGVPVALGLPVGHGNDNLALPLGLAADLDADCGRLTVCGVDQGCGPFPHAAGI